MTSRCSTGRSDDSPGQRLISPWGWCWLFGFGLLFIYLYRHFLWRMIRIATGEWGGDWSHALIVPVISSYFIIQNRDRIAATARYVYWPGLVILFLGLFCFAWCIYPVRNDMLQGYSMIVTLFGLVLFLLGPRMMRWLWFPIMYLALGVKISERLWEQIAWQLQLVAAQSAAVTMRFFAVEATVQGSTIDIAFRRDGQWVVEPINVAEACSGLRMLMAFVALGAAMAYLTDRAWWKRLVMLGLAVPIAVVVNIGRVTAVGLLFTVNKEMATGDFHVFVGMLMLIPAAGLFMLVGWVLDRVVIDEPDPPPSPAKRLIASPVGESTVHWQNRWIAGALVVLGVVTTGMGLFGIAQGDRIYKIFVSVPFMSYPVAMFGLALLAACFRVINAAVFGALLTVLIGFEYAFFLAAYRPEELFAGRLSSEFAFALFGGGLMLVTGGLWWVRRATKGGGAPGAQVISLGIGLGVLLAAVLGLDGVVRATKTVLVKQPLPIRRPLHLLPDRAGTWVMEFEEPPLSADILEALGTKQYTSRIYRDTQQMFKGPEARVRLHMAYYTGTPDTVPHVPDRCFMAGGRQRIAKGRTTIKLSGPWYLKDDPSGWVTTSKLEPKGVRIPELEFPATIFTFSEPGGSASNVVYFFVANGKLLPTPERVRATAFDLRDRYSYYCKVEVGLFDVADAKLASQRVSAFLSVMMPEIMACLPDWGDVSEER